MLAAWNDYLAHDNHGRGVVLIGHSQGAYILKHLVQTVIDRSAAQRRLLVSAILLGGQVLAANGPADKGDFAHVPACASPSATGCVIAYSSFGQLPPKNASFGRDPSPATHVLCVNPAAPGSTAATPVTPLFPSSLLRLAGARLGGQMSPVSTPWVAYPGLYTVQCKRVGSASWLQVTRTHLARRSPPGDTPLLRRRLRAARHRREHRARRARAGGRRAGPRLRAATLSCARTGRRMRYPVPATRERGTRESHL